MVVQGHSNTVPVTINDMCYHTECAARANTHALLMADLPFGCLHSPGDALVHATALMQSGAHMVKCEGGAWLTETVEQLTRQGIPVCAHLGLTPQSVHLLGGFRRQATTEASANRLYEEATKLEAAGAQLLVLECVPDTVARQVQHTLNIPTIGIGAGPHCDGQILVTQDMLGCQPGEPYGFVKSSLPRPSLDPQALSAYVRRWPSPIPEETRT